MLPLYILTTLYRPFFPFLKYTLYPLAPLTFLIFTFILLPDLFAFITGFPGFVIHFAILEDEPFTTLHKCPAFVYVMERYGTIL